MTDLRICLEFILKLIQRILTLEQHTLTNHQKKKFAKSKKTLLVDISKSKVYKLRSFNIIKKKVHYQDDWKDRLLPGNIRKINEVECSKIITQNAIKDKFPHLMFFYKQSSVISKNILCLYSEYVYGTDMTQWVGQLHSHKTILNIFVQIYAAINYLNNTVGIIHGDVQARNIIISKTPKPIDITYSNIAVLKDVNFLVIFIDYGGSKFIDDKNKNDDKKSIINILYPGLIIDNLMAKYPLYNVESMLTNKIKNFNKGQIKSEISKRINGQFEGTGSHASSSGIRELINRRYSRKIYHMAKDNNLLTSYLSNDIIKNFIKYISETNDSIGTVINKYYGICEKIK